MAKAREVTAVTIRCFLAEQERRKNQLLGEIQRCEDPERAVELAEKLIDTLHEIQAMKEIIGEE